MGYLFALLLCVGQKSPLICNVLQVTLGAAKIIKQILVENISKLAKEA